MNMTTGEIPKRISMPLADRIQYVVRITADQQLHCVIHFDGNIDEDRIRQAMRLTLDAEPVLGCRFVEYTGRSYWERRHDLDDIESCSLVRPMDAEKALLRFMVTPTNPRLDPLVHARIFRSDTDTLCIKLDHVVGDAGGLRDYVYLLCRIYRRLADEPEYLPEPNLWGDRGMGQVIKRFSLKQRLRALSCISPPRQLWGFPWSTKGYSDRTFIIRHIDRDGFTAIRKYGRHHTATVNDVMLTVFFRSLFQLIDPKPGVPLTVQVPVDMRRYLPGGKAEAICNQSGGLFPKIARRPGVAFDRTLMQVRDTMNAFKDRDPGLGGWLFLAFCFGLLFRFGFHRVEKGAQWVGDKVISRSEKGNPILSNLGILDGEQLDFGETEVTHAFLVSPVLYPPYFMLGISRFNDTMTITAGFCEARNNRHIMERFLDLIEDEISVVQAG